MTTAIDEIARLTVRVQELEADLRAAQADLEGVDDELAIAQSALEDATAQADHDAYERAWTALSEFVADVRRGIRTLDEFEAVCA